MKLLFVESKIPRTMTRPEWKELHRWKRKTQKRLAEEMDRKLNIIASSIADGVVFGRFHYDVLNEAINPPLLIGPYQ